MEKMQDQMFSTKEQDNDDTSSENCADVYGNAGWWFGRCHRENMNGKYYTEGSTDANDGVNWYQFKNNFVSLKKTWFMIRPSSFVPGAQVETS